MNFCTQLNGSTILGCLWYFGNSTESKSLGIFRFLITFDSIVSQTNVLKRVFTSAGDNEHSKQNEIISGI